MFDLNENPLFCNYIFLDFLSSECGSTTCNLEYQRPTKELALNALESFTLHESNTASQSSTLKAMIEDWPEEPAFEAGKFVCTTKDQSIYVIKGLKATFHETQCKVLIFQDQTEEEKSQKLNDKYQRLYIASIAHDIRTPLNGIIGMLDMMSDVKDTYETPVYVSVAKSACKLLLYLTYNITDYSQLEANKFKPNNDRVNIKEVLNEALQLFCFNFQKKNLSLSLNIDVEVPTICCIDKNRYMQILLNLLSNTLKFTLKGGVTVTVTHDPNKDLLITSVKDTGIGIKSEEISKLFKLFGKLENNTLNPQGVGFGLSICKQLSESLGGYVEVESIYKQGSTFRFAIKANTFAQLKELQKIESGIKVDANDVPKVEDELTKKSKTVNFKSSLLDSLCMG